MMAKILKVAIGEMNMNNFKEELIKLLKNKNTLTILIVLLGIVGVYFVYNRQVTQAVTKIKVPYAKKELTSRTKIDKETIGYTELPKKIASKLGIITNISMVLDNYVKYGYTIPENGFFYKDLVVDFEQAVQNEISDIPSNYTVFKLDVDINSTYGNSIYTGNYVDLYVKAVDSNNMIIFGRLFQGIKVLAVLDSAGNDVFESSAESRTPAEMWFAVSDEFNQLLSGAMYIGGGIKIMPIPRNASYSDYDREPTIDSTFIKSYIESKLLSVNSNYTPMTSPNSGQ